VALVKGDLFIIRSSKDTLGGGEIVDAYPKRHRRFHVGTIKGLVAREKGSSEETVLAILEAKEPVALEELWHQSSLSRSEAAEVVKSLASGGKLVLLGDKGAQTTLFSATGWHRLADKVKQVVGDHHRRFPLRRGLPKEELRSRLGVSPQSFPAALRQLVGDDVLAEEEKTVRLPSYHVQLNKEQKTAVDAYLKALSQSPYSPSSETGIDPELLDYLMEQRQVVKLAGNVIFTASAYDEMVQFVISHIKAKGKITVAEVRDMFHTSRKYALALMEHLDEQKVTRRVGDERVLR
jgi:selenocysteine-specific elongation factor